VTKLTALSDRRHRTCRDATASAPILRTEYSFPGKREPHRVLRNQPEALNPSTRNWKLETAFPHSFPILSRNRFSCSSVQYPQSSRINTDVYGIVIVLFSTKT
jgi:hypothetical protein